MARPSPSGAGEDVRVAGDAENGPVLEAEGVSLRFGGVRALTDVSFAVKRGEVFSIIGPNGAGKTSMVNCISGRYRPTEGRIVFDGRDITRTRTSRRVELARAVALKPKLILLDEPMAGMNLEEKEDMARYILDLNEEWGMTVLMIEHDMGVVMDISHRVMVLDFGRKIAEGMPEAVLADPHVRRAYLGEADEVVHDADEPVTA